MNLEWGSKEAWKFDTNVGLVLTRDKKGKDNIMACEWTHNISYVPWLIAICIRKGNRSGKNVKERKQFSVNLASETENILSSVAGGSHGDSIDKIAALKDLGFKFEPAKKIKTLVIPHASLIAECKLVKTISPGSHDVFIGEVVHSAVGDKDSLIYHEGKYWKKGESIRKPDELEMTRIKSIIEKHKM
jgi:flavin reductase (DIM6/NTAB) family NADH-FMN oxidoreductase RutF